MLLGKRSKASINTLIASTMENNEALSKRARPFLHVFRLGLPDIRVRVYKQGYNVRTWNEVGNRPRRFAPSNADRKVAPVTGGDAQLLRLPGGALAADSHQQPARAHPARDPAAHACRGRVS